MSRELAPTSAAAIPPQPPSLSKKLYSSRFRRNKRTRTTLAPIELEILTIIHSYKLLTTTDLIRLCLGRLSKDTLYRTLRKLYDSHHLHRLEDTNLTNPIRYVLGPNGANALGASTVPTSHWQTRNLIHRDLITATRIAFTIACRNRTPEAELLWETPTATALRPDGLAKVTFTELPPGRNRTNLFIEADCSTEKRNKYLAKLEAYASLDPTLYGCKTFRVLTITKTKERLRSLLQGSQKENILWFTTETAMAGADVLTSPIWHVPTHGHVLPLI